MDSVSSKLLGLLAQRVGEQVVAVLGDLVLPVVATCCFLGTGTRFVLLLSEGGTSEELDAWEGIRPTDIGRFLVGDYGSTQTESILMGIDAWTGSRLGILLAVVLISVYGMYSRTFPTSIYRIPVFGRKLVLEHSKTGVDAEFSMRDGSLIPWTYYSCWILNFTAVVCFQVEPRVAFVAGFYCVIAGLNEAWRTTMLPWSEFGPGVTARLARSTSWVYALYFPWVLFRFAYMAWLREEWDWGAARRSARRDSPRLPPSRRNQH